MNSVTLFTLKKNIWPKQDYKFRSNKSAVSKVKGNVVPVLNQVSQHEDV